MPKGILLVLVRASETFVANIEAVVVGEPSNETRHTAPHKVRQNNLIKGRGEIRASLEVVATEVRELRVGVVWGVCGSTGWVN
jgi:hypothetical protein